MNKRDYLRKIEKIEKEINTKKQKNNSFTNIMCVLWIASLFIFIIILSIDIERASIRLKTLLNILMIIVSLIFIISFILAVVFEDRHPTCTERKMLIREFENCLKAYPLMIIDHLEMTISDPAHNALQTIKNVRNCLEQWQITPKTKIISKLQELLNTAEKIVNELETASHSFSSIITYETDYRYQPLNQYRRNCMDISNTIL